MKAAFWGNGWVRAGNWSERSDGGGGVMMMEREKGEGVGLKGVGKFGWLGVGGGCGGVVGGGKILWMI